MIKEKSEEKEAGALGSEGEAEKRERKEAGRRRSARAKETESKGSRWVKLRSCVVFRVRRDALERSGAARLKSERNGRRRLGSE